MAYERVITACDRAIAAAAATTSATERQACWRQTFHDETVRAQAILVELGTMLRTKHPEPAVAALAGQLEALYRFALDQLVKANMTKDPKPLRSVRSTVDGLREAWIAGVLGG